MPDWIAPIGDLAQQPNGKEVLAAITSVAATTVSAAVALFATFVSVVLARRNIRASMSGASRQKWVDELRQTLAELLAVNFVVAHAQSKQNDPETSIRVFTLRNTIRLLTLGDDPEHQALNRAIDRLIEAPASRGYDSAAEDALIVLSHRILETESAEARLGR